LKYSWKGNLKNPSYSLSFLHISQLRAEFYENILLFSEICAPSAPNLKMLPKQYIYIRLVRGPEDLFASKIAFFINILKYSWKVPSATPILRSSASDPQPRIHILISSVLDPQPRIPGLTSSASDPQPHILSLRSSASDPQPRILSLV